MYNLTGFSKKEGGQLLMRPHTSSIALGGKLFLRLLTVDCMIHLLSPRGIERRALGDACDSEQCQVHRAIQRFVDRVEQCCMLRGLAGLGVRRPLVYNLIIMSYRRSGHPALSSTSFTATELAMAFKSLFAAVAAALAVVTVQGMRNLHFCDIDLNPDNKFRCRHQAGSLPRWQEQCCQRGVLLALLCP